MQKELEDKEAAEAAAKAKKKMAANARLQKQLDTWESVAAPPSELFKGNKDYGEFDATGLPTKMADGSAISNSATKKNVKAMSKYTKAHDNLKAKSGGDIAAFLADQKSQLL